LFDPSLDGVRASDYVVADSSVRICGFSRWQVSLLSANSHVQETAPFRFDNIFMVAADVRAVTFDETGGVEKVGPFWGEKKEEHEGEAILRLAKHKRRRCTNPGLWLLRPCWAGLRARPDLSLKHRLKFYCFAAPADKPR